MILKNKNIKEWFFSYYFSSENGNGTCNSTMKIENGVHNFEDIKKVQEKLMELGRYQNVTILYYKLMN